MSRRGSPEAVTSPGRGRLVRPQRAAAWELANPVHALALNPTWRSRNDYPRWDTHGGEFIAEPVVGARERRR